MYHCYYCTSHSLLHKSSGAERMHTSVADFVGTHSFKLIFRACCQLKCLRVHLKVFEPGSLYLITPARPQDPYCERQVSINALFKVLDKVL
jgi:hypothetical protein